MYDARGGSNPSNNNAVFGLVIIGVIVAAFAAVFMWPSGGETPPTQIAESNAPLQINASFASKVEREIASTIAEIDPKAYERFESRLSSGSGDSAERDEIIISEFSLILLSNVDVIGKADVKHFNAMLSDLRGGLQKASRSGSKLCKGSTYAKLDKMGPAKVEQFMRHELMNNEGVRAFGLNMTHRMLEAIADARKNPVKHGAMNASDESAVQGLVMSLVTQPEIMMLAMAANSGSGAEAALAKANICQLSVAALKAVDTLPDRTKGRIWAQTFTELQKNDAFDFDPSALQSMVGF